MTGPFRLGVLLAWIRAHGPWRWASVELRARGYSGRTLVTAVPYLWLLLFFLVPFLIVLKISVSEIRLAMPPYEPLVTWLADDVIGLRINLANYAFLLSDSLYWKSFLNSITTAAISTVICLLIGYPMAYVIARSSPAWRNLLLLLVMLPFWTSFLLRVYAWKGLLADQGVINRFMMFVGISSEPIPMLNTNVSMLVGMTYVYLPFMLFPMTLGVSMVPKETRDAAFDLGASKWQVFKEVDLPLSMPGIMIGFLLAFVLAVGAIAEAKVLGGQKVIPITHDIEIAFTYAQNWPLGSALAVLLMLVVGVLVLRVLRRFDLDVILGRR